MKISKISYEREILINVRPFENVRHKVGMEATLEPGEDPAEAFGELKAHINMGLLAAAAVTIRHLDPHKREQLLKENGWLDDYAAFLEAEEEIQAWAQRITEEDINPAELSKAAQDFVDFVDSINAEDVVDTTKEPPIRNPGRRAH